MSTKLYRRFCYFIFLFTIAILFCLIADISADRFITTPNSMSAIAQPVRINSPERSPSRLERGILRYRMGQYKKAIEEWQSALSPDLSAKDRAALHNNLAQAYSQIGQPESAIAQWQQAISIYRSDADQAKNTPLAAALIEQAQMYSDLGQHRNAMPLLLEAIAIARRTPDRKLEAAGLGALGTAYWGLGEYDAVQPGSDGIPNNALEAQSASLEMARQLNDPFYAPFYVVTALNNRGNAYLRRAERYQFQAEAARLEGETKTNQRFTQLAAQDTIAAQQDYEESVQLSRNIGGITEAQALLDLNHLLAQRITQKRDRDRQMVITNRDRILSLLVTAPDSQDKAFALIRLAIAGQHQNPNQSIENLTIAIATARNIDNKRAESFALGSLGYIYETLQQYERALELTRQAQNTAQLANAADSLYRWQWQAGRILKNSHNPANNPTAAIASYRGAIATLQTIRGDLISASKELQFNFRDSVEPVYREFIDLLLHSEPGATASNLGNRRNSNINEALNTLELLKLAELQNFFGDECVQVARDRAKDRQTISDPHTAIIYSIVLDRHTELILRSPNQPLKKYTIEISASELGTTADRLRQFLENQATEEYLPDAQKVYDLLIRPLEPDLEALKATTLVFINDRELRKLPMAALHDGKQFAIQKYAIATTPSLELTALNAPVSSDRSDMQALILGLTKATPPFAALPNVAMETTQVQNILGGTTFLDEEFTLERIKQNLRERNYQVLHIATHGKFGANPENTFLVGGGNTRISITELDQLFSSRKDRQAIELLTLSACQTAAGDNRSTLGMAGVAVRAGARSAIATLWFINDAGTVPLIQEFYSQLRHTQISKAEALRRAQMKLIADKDYNHPAIWSPFILIGSWL